MIQTMPDGFSGSTFINDPKYVGLIFWDAFLSFDQHEDAVQFQTSLMYNNKCKAIIYYRTPNYEHCVHWITR